MQLKKRVTLPAEKPGYEFEISEYSYHGGTRGTFIYRKIWPCEDGIFEPPVVSTRLKFIHSILLTMRQYLTKEQYKEAKLKLGPRWIDI